MECRLSPEVSHQLVADRSPVCVVMGELRSAQGPRGRGTGPGVTLTGVRPHHFPPLGPDVSVCKVGDPCASQHARRTAERLARWAGVGRAARLVVTRRVLHEDRLYVSLRAHGGKKTQGSESELSSVLRKSAPFSLTQV